MMVVSTKRVFESKNNDATIVDLAHSMPLQRPARTRQMMRLMLRAAAAVVLLLSCGETGVATCGAQHHCQCPTRPAARLDLAAFLPCRVQTKPTWCGVGRAP